MELIPITAQTVFSCLPKRERESHKGCYGTVLAICGSFAYRGAAVLACGGALRSGAGIVRLASIERVIDAVLAKHSECTLLPLAEGETGGIDAEAAMPRLAKAMAGSRAVLIGCGMGNTADTAALVRFVLQNAAGTVVIDADGLNSLSRQADLPALIGACRHGVILTPHVGEMARLSRLSVEEIKADAPGVAARFAKEWGCVLVLKDAVTYIASPNGLVYQNTTGNPGLARGGSGDVLAGIIASLAAQGREPIEAAFCGAWLHGAAADECAARYSESGMLPSDLNEGLCRVFSAYQR